MDKKLTERQVSYFKEVLPKLDARIVAMDLGMRANTCLVSAGVCTLEELKKAIKENRHIPLLGEESLKDIKEHLKAREE